MSRRHPPTASTSTPTLQKKKSKKELPQIPTNKRECIVLLDEGKMKSYKIFLDEEIGLSPTFQKILHETVNIFKFSQEMKTMTVLRKSLIMESICASTSSNKI